MRDGKKEYELCKEACKREGCFCPEDYDFHNIVANTPMFIRAYFYLKGKKSNKGEENENSTTKR